MQCVLCWTLRCASLRHSRVFCTVVAPTVFHLLINRTPHVQAALSVPIILNGDVKEYADIDKVWICELVVRMTIAEEGASERVLVLLEGHSGNRMRFSDDCQRSY